MDIIADQQCFACGLENPGGLRLQFHRETDTYVTRFIADAMYQGYHGVVHGGIIATLLDEIMARYVWELDGPSATAKLSITYRHPAPVGKAIVVRGWICTRHRGGKAVETAATASLEDGTLLAEATGLIIRLAPSPGGKVCTP